MIIAQHLAIRKEDIPALVQCLKDKGYTLACCFYSLDPTIAFDAYKSDYGVYFRFISQPLGDITGIITRETGDILPLLEDIYQFVQPMSYIFFTGYQQCDLDGYFVSSSGIYEAVDLRVRGTQGECITRKEDRHDA